MIKIYLHFVEIVVDKTSILLQKLIPLSSENLIVILAKYFYYTSKITNFWFFNRLGQFIYYIFHVIVFIHNGNNFTYIYYATLHNGWNTFFTNFLTYLNWDFFFLLGFLGLLSELSFNNTVLISIPKVNTKIIELYGPDFPKQVGYNSRFNTLARNGERFGILAASLGAAFVGSVAGQIHESDTYKQNYKDYIDAQTQNPDVKLSPPQRSNFN